MEPAINNLNCSVSLLHVDNTEIDDEAISTHVLNLSFGFMIHEFYSLASTDHIYEQIDDFLAERENHVCLTPYNGVFDPPTHPRHALFKQVVDYVEHNYLGSNFNQSDGSVDESDTSEEDRCLHCGEGCMPDAEGLCYECANFLSAGPCGVCGEITYLNEQGICPYC